MRRSVSIPFENNFCTLVAVWIDEGDRCRPRDLGTARVANDGDYAGGGFNDADINIPHAV